MNDYYDSEYQKLLLDIITKYLYKVTVIYVIYYFSMKTALIYEYKTLIQK